MSSNTHAHGHEHDTAHSHASPLKIYFILLGLLIVSIIGPEFGIQWVTLITAFGIAVVKALMVAAHYMHLKLEKQYIWWLFLICLLAMGIMFAGVSPDVMKTGGQNWTDCVADKTCIDTLRHGAAEHVLHPGLPKHGTGTH